MMEYTQLNQEKRQVQMEMIHSTIRSFSIRINQ
jgi:hypothetical protein